MPTVLYTQDDGFCQPILRSMDDLFGRTILPNSSTGTLNALLSPANRNAISTIPVKGSNGKDIQYRFQYQKRSACPTELGDCVDLADQDFCAAIAPNPVETVEYVWDSSDLCSRPVWSGSYDYDRDATHCDVTLADTMAREINEAIENYAIALNHQIWQELTQPYTVPAGAPDPCVNSEQFGVGKCGWLDLNQQYYPAGTPIELQIMNSVGAIFPFFSQNFGNLLTANGINRAPIVVHGNGALKTYLEFLTGGAYQCCSDSGVNQAALAAQYQMFAFMEGRPTANRNAGVSQDTVLLWEPGAHQMIQPFLLGQPLQNLNDPSHQRYQFFDTRYGLAILARSS